MTTNIQADFMPTFMMSLNWTDQGIRAIKDLPKRSEAARDLAKKVGVEIKHLYLTLAKAISSSSSICRAATMLPSSR